MTTFLSDELDALRIHLAISYTNGLNVDQVGVLDAVIKQYAQKAREQENEISRLTWNLNVRTDAFTTVCANLDRAEALLRNNGQLYQASNTVLDEVDRPGSNVCLMIRSSVSGSGSGGDAA